MSTTIQLFDFDMVKKERANVLPFNPFVTFVLKEWGATGKGGAPVISPHLMTEREIDEHVAQMKADLDAVAKRAKAALQRAHDATLSAV